MQPFSRLELIRFDYKTKLFIGACSFLYILFIVLKLHNSSIGLWNSTMPDGDNVRRGIIEGDPLGPRSDEWLVNTPFILSQEKNNFPATSHALGAGKVPLVMNLPAHHILSILKPQLWGYYFLDAERGFSWHWNFRIFPFLIASFLFLMLFTRNNFVISAFGSCFLFLGGPIQWWSINTEIFTFGLTTVISLLYIIYSDNKWLIALNGILFQLSSYSYAMVLYPAYQVPLAYFLLALVAGYILSNRNLKAIKLNKWTRLTVLMVSLVTLAALLYLFFKECKETIQIVSNTLYPGKRNESGGDYSFLNIFRGNYSWFVTPNATPAQWYNICEQSAYLMLAPIAFLMVAYAYVKTKKIDPLLLILMLFQLFICCWLFLGFPEWLAKLTMFNTSPTQRSFYILGFANIVFTLLYLNRPVTYPAGQTKKTITFIIIFGIVTMINWFINKKVINDYFTKYQIVNAAIVTTLLYWLIVYFNERKEYQQIFYIASLLFVVSNLLVNPLCKGLAPFFENKIYKAVEEIEAKDPEAPWLAFGDNMTTPDFLKAAGVNCFDGVQFAPLLNEFKVLDPGLKNEEVYNRYAHILFLPLESANDSVKFTPIQPDFYHVRIDPCSPSLKQIGIKYFMFNTKPAPPLVREMTLVKEICGFYIYKRNGL